MYLQKVHIAPSEIEGLGVFTDVVIKKGDIAWLFNPEHDTAMTEQEFKALPKADKNEFYHSGYLSPWTGLWISPPKQDPACYTNHSANHNLSVVYDSAVSSEPYFVANRDISAGEELTDNYYEFDIITQRTNPSWAK